MRDSDRVRAIFAELRKIKGLDAPAADLLRLANFLLQVFKARFDDLREFGRPYEPRNFATLDVDQAMADGGWKILEFELEHCVDFEEREARFQSLLDDRLRDYLGPAWQQRTPPG